MRLLDEDLAKERWDDSLWHETIDTQVWTLRMYAQQGREIDAPEGYEEVKAIYNAALDALEAGLDTILSALEERDPDLLQTAKSHFDRSGELVREAAELIQQLLMAERYREGGQ